MQLKNYSLYFLETGTKKKSVKPLDDLPLSAWMLPAQHEKISIQMRARTMSMIPPNVLRAFKSASRREKSKVSDGKDRKVSDEKDRIRKETKSGERNGKEVKEEPKSKKVHKVKEEKSAEKKDSRSLERGRKVERDRREKSPKKVLKR